jgi:ribosomal protein S18 acetylase RimI-like enzyme
MPMGEEDYLRWLNESTFDPSLWRLAWDGDQVAGMVLAFVNATENAEYNRRRGYTEDICVRRPWRRRGLARALIARSLRGLRARGMTEAALGVDTENISGALRLYESLGYRPVQRWALLRKPLDQAAGRGLSREAVESGAST